MSIERLLIIGQTDLSAYVTQDGLNVKYTPVYDESSAFTAIDGNDVRDLLGYKVTISAVLEDITDTEASAMAETMLADTPYSVGFAFPDARTEQFETVSLSLEPICGTVENNYWSAAFVIVSRVIPLDSL
ncbi:MAG: hypothetical protein II664_04520 [Oscillospiraceae bacterium]|nr:hypothetical protein [Oscillospiraceae bacterium]